MGIILVHGYLAYKFLTKPPSDITNVSAQAMCADGDEEAGESISAGKRSARQAMQALSAVSAPCDRLTYSLVRCLSLGVGGVRRQGGASYAMKIMPVELCSTGLDSPKPKLFSPCNLVIS